MSSVDLRERKAPGKNAAGTEYWSVGVTWLAERDGTSEPGPRHSVTSVEKARRLLGTNDNGNAAPASHHFDLQGALVTQDLLAEVNAIGQTAAAHGAAMSDASGCAVGVVVWAAPDERDAVDRWDREPRDLAPPVLAGWRHSLMRHHEAITWQRLLWGVSRDIGRA